MLRAIKLERSLARLVLFMAALVATAHVHAATALYFDFVPGPTSGLAPSTHLYELGPDEIFLSTDSAFTSSIVVAAVAAGQVGSPDTVNLNLLLPAGQFFGHTFAVQPYEMLFLGDDPLQLRSSFTGPGVSCSPQFQSGRVVILEASFDGSNNVLAFAADIEQVCPDGSELYAEFRYNSSLPLTADKPPAASTPDPFAFVPHSGVPPGQVTTSNTITAYGMRSPAAISITGGEYSLNGGAFTSAPGTVSNRDHVSVRVTASASTGTTTSAILTIGGVSASFDVTTFAPGAPFTGVYLQRGSPPIVGSSTTLLAQPPDWTIVANDSVGGNPGAAVDVIDAGLHNQFDIIMQAPLGHPLVPGAYETAYFESFSALPTLAFSSSGDCFAAVGRFVIHENVPAPAPSTSFDRFAASFEVQCSSGDPLFGEIRINSAVPLSITAPSPRTTPYPFALSAQSPVLPGTVVQSNWTTIDGIDQPVPISITGGEYSLNGAPFTSAPGTVNPRDEVVVRLTASQTPGDVQEATLTAGGGSATLSVTTYQAGMALSGFYYRVPPNPSSPAKSGFELAPPGIMSISLDSFAPGGIDATLFGTSSGDAQWLVALSSPAGTQLTPGLYTNATTGVFQPFTGGIITAGRDTSCSGSGQFVVREAVYDVNGVPQRFAADLECTGTIGAARFFTGPVYGELRYNSTVPFSALLPPVMPLANIATRGDVLTGDNVVIGGFIIGGSTNKTVAITGTGPSLVPFGVTNPLANPMLTLVRMSDQTVIGTNDDWQTDPNASQLQASGFAPPDPSEAGMLITLPPGAYTAILQGKDGGTGVGVVGIFEVDHPETPLVNIATRGLVGAGDNVLIGGFIVHGSGPQTVAIVATGPSLAGFGITNPLMDPTLTLVRSSDQAVLATNDDWQSATNFAQLQQTGFAPTDPHESAILVTLDPGAYTAILAGKGGTTGVGVVAVYTVQ